MGANSSKYTPPFNDSIMKTIAVVPKFTAMPSIIGSLFIIQDVLRSKKKQRSIYHRIMVGMSAMDLLWAIRCFLSTWIVPKEFHPVIPYASGTNGTCTFVGFLGHASATTSVLYSGALTLYFLLVVRFGYPEDRIRRYYGKLFHLIPILLGWGFAIASIPLGLYKPVPWTCFIQQVPYACKKAVRFASVAPETCIPDGVSVGGYRWGFFFAWIWATFIWMAVALAMIYWGLLRTERTSQKYTFTSTAGGASGISQRCNQQSVVSLPSNASKNIDSHHMHSTDDVEGLQHTIPLKGGANGADDEEGPQGQSIVSLSQGSGDAAVYHQDKVVSQNISRSNSAVSFDERSVDTNDSSVAPATLKRSCSYTRHRSTMSSRSTANEPKRNSKKFAAQATLYVAFFWITWIFSTIQGSINAFVGTGYSYLLVLVTILAPLQGFFNFLIYVRPRYLRYRKNANPEASMWKLVVSKICACCGSGNG